MTDAPSDLVRADRRDAVTILVIDRPAQRNALNPALLGRLVDLLQDADADPGTGAIVLTGGQTVFCAGADIEVISGHSPASYLGSPTRFAFEAIRRVRKPIVAAVAGFCLGGGCELALSCDMILAGDSAQFGQPEINLGIIPGAGGTQRLVRALGKFRAMKLLMTGTAIDAREAERIGLVSELVPDAELMNRVTDLATELAALSPIALAEIKDVVLNGEDLPLSAGLALERKSYNLMFATEDQKEGMAAFIDKRKPDFKGR